MRFLLLLLISISIFGKNNYFWSMTEENINKSIINLHKNNKDYSQRLKKITSLFLKTPYVLNVLGEGVKKPTYSFKGVDCVTYVETVLAISNRSNLKDSISLLQQIRYKNGKINYKKRNHFMMTQWIPFNEKLGLIENITDNFINKKYKIKTQKMKKQIDLNKFNKKFKSFKNLKEDLPLGNHEVKYIPVYKFIKYQNKLDIKDGTIMVIIRENREDYPIFTSHLGFIINSKKGRIFRSAVTNSRFKEVRDYNLNSYLRFYTNYYSKTNWKIVGVSLYLPKELNEDK